jgi:hypothetical protein
MSTKYQVCTDAAEVVNFCLNCKRKKCHGDCEELKAVKKRIEKHKKGGKNEQRRHKKSNG